MRKLLLTAPALLLAACAAGPQYPDGRHGGSVPPVRPATNSPMPPAPGARVLGYVCEDLTRIVLTEGQRGARATFNSGLELALSPAGPGRYGAPPYEFHAMSSDGVWINQGRSVRCRVG